MPDPTLQKQDGRFRKGQSGNPAGKPRGTRNAATLLAEKLMSADIEAVVQAVIAKAHDGDMVAARLILERIAPARRDNAVTFALPALKSPADAQVASAAILAAVASGELTPGEAADLSKLVDGYIRAVEATELEARLARLEADLKRTEDRQ